MDDDSTVAENDLGEQSNAELKDLDGSVAFSLVDEAVKANAVSFFKTNKY